MKSLSTAAPTDTQVHGMCFPEFFAGLDSTYEPIKPRVSSPFGGFHFSTSGLLSPEVESILTRTTQGEIMKTGKGFLTLYTLCALMACNTQPSQNVDSSASAEEDRYHEKSFSWDSNLGKVSPQGVLAKTAAAKTRFETVEELGLAAQAMDEALKVPGASDSLWKPIDYACDELALGLWNRYGTISVGDSVVLDEVSLKASCRYIGEDGKLTKLSKSSETVFPTEAIDRQYPYKMIGDSWNNFNAVLYKSTGGETQFKKERKIWGVTGWYDLDATRIGIRIYAINCPAPGIRNCKIRTSSSSWNANDDYVSNREIALGLAARADDAVVSLHSVDHAGLQFRAISSSGLSTAMVITNPTSYNYVT